MESVVHYCQVFGYDNRCRRQPVTSVGEQPGTEISCSPSFLPDSVLYLKSKCHRRAHDADTDEPQPSLAALLDLFAHGVSSPPSR